MYIYVHITCITTLTLIHQHRIAVILGWFPLLTHLLHHYWREKSILSIPFHSQKYYLTNLLLRLPTFSKHFWGPHLFSTTQAPLKEPPRKSRGFPFPETAWMIESYFAVPRVHPAVRDERGATAPPQLVAAVRTGFPWFPRFAWRGVGWVMFWLRHSGASPPSIGRWLQNKGIEHLKRCSGCIKYIKAHELYSGHLLSIHLNMPKNSQKVITFLILTLQGVGIAPLEPLHHPKVGL